MVAFCSVVMLQSIIANAACPCSNVCP